jgi:hypothetical protein
MRIPDRIAPVVGYRSWAIGLGRLWSVHGPGRTPWPRSRPLRATCLKLTEPSFTTRAPLHAAPESGCDCGIYGAFEPWDITLRQPRLPWTLVTGRVEVWGRVMVGSRGFRSEIARPLELFAESWWDERTKRSIALIAKSYGVPLISLEWGSVSV